MPQEFRAVVGDFGIAQLGEGALGVKEFVTSRAVGVTIEYAPPELIKLFRHTATTKPSRSLFKRIDCHSFAVTVFELLTQKKAWRGYRSLDEVERAVLAGKRPNVELVTTEMYGARRDTLVRILSKSWAVEPASRPEMARIKQKLHDLIFSDGLSTEEMRITPASATQSNQ